MYKAAAVLSAVMTVYIITCHDRGNINVLLVLQSCTDSLHILPGSSGESHATSADGACNFSNMQVEEDVDVKEVGFIGVMEESGKCIKQEEIPKDINFPVIKAEPDEVSFVCVRVCGCVRARVCARAADIITVGSWYRNPKVSCLVVFGDEGTFGPTTVMLSRKSWTNPLTWEVM
jgi:hypothetical protein